MEPHIDTLTAISPVKLLVADDEIAAFDPRVSVGRCIRLALLIAIPGNAQRRHLRAVSDEQVLRTVAFLSRRPASQRDVDDLDGWVARDCTPSSHPAALSSTAEVRRQSSVVRQRDERATGRYRRSGGRIGGCRGRPTGDEERAKAENHPHLGQDFNPPVLIDSMICP